MRFFASLAVVGLSLVQAVFATPHLTSFPPNAVKTGDQIALTYTADNIGAPLELVLISGPTRTTLVPVPGNGGLPATVTGGSFTWVVGNPPAAPVFGILIRQNGLIDFSNPFTLTPATVVTSSSTSSATSTSSSTSSISGTSTSSVTSTSSGMSTSSGVSSLSTYSTSSVGVSTSSVTVLPTGTTFTSVLYQTTTYCPETATAVSPVVYAQASAYPSVIPVVPANGTAGVQYTPPPAAAPAPAQVVSSNSGAHLSSSIVLLVCAIAAAVHFN